MTSKPSLLQRFQLLLIALSIGAFLATVLIFSWSNYTSHRDNLFKRLESQSRLFSLILAEPVADNDSELIKSLLLPIISDRNFSAVEVRDRNGVILDRFGDIETVMDPSCISVVPISFANENGVQVVGELRLAVTFTELQKRLKTDIGTHLAFFLSLVVLVIVISRFSFKKTVSGRLDRLFQSIERFKDSGVHKAIDHECADELGQVVLAYNTMQGHQLEIQDELKRHQLELENLVEQRTRQLAHEASHDPLTGLLNRREFKRLATRQYQDHKQQDGTLALAFIDLDHFKIVNDTHGHEVGDKLLSTIAQLLSKHFDEYGMIGRLGGDEFGLLLKTPHVEKAIALCKHFLKYIAKYRFQSGPGLLQTSMSMGLIILDGSIDSVSTALRHADECCYIAKERGRNRLHIYDENDNYLLTRNQHLRWVSLIDQGLNRDQTELWWQPIVPFDHTVDRQWVELLVRYRDDDGIIHNAGDFLNPIEQFGVAHKLDLWVLQTALQWITTLSESSVSPPMCSINLSGRSISEPTFLSECQELIRQYPACRGMLCFEITESFAILNFEVARNFIRELAQQGHRFALDDFGSGLSSFVYLKELDVDFLKIDGSFVTNMLSNEVDHKMIASMNEIAHSLNLKTVAEYVENAEQAQQLREIGLDYLQGNYIGMAASPSEYNGIQQRLDETVT